MPEIARFTQEDSHKGNLVAPQSLNPYMHCFNNPLRYVDWDGCTGMDANSSADGGGGSVNTETNPAQGNSSTNNTWVQEIASSPQATPIQVDVVTGAAVPAARISQVNSLPIV